MTGTEAITDVEVFRTDDRKLKRRAALAVDPYFPVGLHGQPDPEAALRKMLRFAEFIVAVRAGGPVGLSVMYANDLQTRAAYITLFGVMDACGRQGVGKKLLDASEELARSRGMERIRLEVTDSNERAVRFYTKNGFVRTGACEEDSSFMEKML